MLIQPKITLRRKLHLKEKGGGELTLHAVLLQQTSPTLSPPRLDPRQQSLLKVLLSLTRLFLRCGTGGFSHCRDGDLCQARAPFRPRGTRFTPWAQVSQRQKHNAGELDQIRSTRCYLCHPWQRCSSSHKTREFRG